MTLAGRRTFVGFGFGPIQTGLFLSEAFASGGFGRLVVAEIVPDWVAAIRRTGKQFSINVAHRDRVEVVTVSPVEIADPASELDRQLLVQAIATADEMATALPSVEYYVSENPGSVHRLLARGLRAKARKAGPPAVIYTGENNNHAAETLEALVLEEVPQDERTAVAARVRFLNTVIGKMCQLVSDPQEIRDYGLMPLSPELPRAVLVEAFNRILVSKIRFDDRFVRGITVFEEKEDLLPFEEAKLYGHNATHALGGYLGALAGVDRVADLGTVPGLVPLIRAAFMKESGEALVRKYKGVDPLFTQAGYRRYAEDLLARMMNPLLRDTTERVTRDTVRKLGWDDRLIGTMRLALTQGIQPRRYALGAAAALAALHPSILDVDGAVDTILGPIWNAAVDEQRAIIQAIEAALGALRAWRDANFYDPQRLEYR
jgi:mannitol-1-phosphate 5-dehydrogenase